MEIEIRSLKEKFDDETFNLKEDIAEEKTDRLLKLTQMKDNLEQVMKAVDKNLAFYKRDIHEDFEDMKEGIEKEIDIRLSHQDQIIENTSNFVKTFQTTLRILGKDAP